MSRRIILGSGSPRRREILSSAGFEFEVITSEADENIDLCEPEDMVKELSKRKSLAVANSLENKENVLVIGADTLVFMDGCRMGKPVDFDDAFRMLSNLSGRSHFVYTGVTLFWGNKDTVEK